MKPFWTNRPLCVVFASFTATSIWLVFGPHPEQLISLLEIISAPTFFDSLAYLALGVISGACQFTFEVVVVRNWVPFLVAKKFIRR